MYCSKCGKENKDSMNFCFNCGNKLHEEVNRTDINIENNEIYRVKNNFTIIIALSIMITVLAIILFKMLVPYMFVSFSITMIEIIIGGIYIYGLKYAITKFKAGEYSLIVDKNGITDYFSIGTIGFIPWKDIKNVYRHKRNNKAVNIKLKNEQEYLNKALFISRLLMLLNKKLGGELISIPYNNEVPAETIIAMYNKYKNS